MRTESNGVERPLPIYSEQEFLQLSGIQHFCFCKRQWALIHIEQLWEDNQRTKEGDIMHKNADDPFFFEKRKDVIISRAVPVRSIRLGLNGVCDVVEFVRSENGVPIKNRSGRYIVYPVEYKIGVPKSTDSDAVQLCAQAMSLEEMLGVEINEAYLYYAKTRRRKTVELNSDLRKRTVMLAEGMHIMFEKGTTPHAEISNSCDSCSLFEICIPSLSKTSTVKKYMKTMERAE